MRALATLRRFHRVLDGVSASWDDLRSCLVDQDAPWTATHPFQECATWRHGWERFWLPWRRSMGEWQRRETVALEGDNTARQNGKERWACSMGHLMGLFDEPWLGMAPTGKMVFLPYVEFARVRGERIVETVFFCDVLSVAMQAGLRPLPPQPGTFVVSPAPMRHDGIRDADDDRGEAALTQLRSFLTLGRPMPLWPSVPSSSHSTADDRQAAYWWGPAGLGAGVCLHGTHDTACFAGHPRIVGGGFQCLLGCGPYAAGWGRPDVLFGAREGFLGMPVASPHTSFAVAYVARCNAHGEGLGEVWLLADVLGMLMNQGLDVLGRLGSVPRM